MEARSCWNGLALVCALILAVGCGDVTSSATTCEDISCGANASCVLGADEVPACECNVGYDGDGETCTDVDECADNNGGCDALVSCTNTDGGFTCGDCPSGYTGDGTAGCLDIDECADGTDDCAAVGGVCTNNGGGFDCACDTGFTGDGLTCTDDDECNLGTDNCSVDADCTNSVGSFECTCIPGYAGDGVTCVLMTLTPDTGIVSDTVTITGLNFGATMGAVTFGGVAATVNSWSDTTIEVVVPDVFPGDVVVDVTPAATAAASANFTVVLPPKVYIHAGNAILNSNNAVVVMDFDPATGALTESANSPVEMGSTTAGWGGICAEQMVIHRATRRLFVTSEASLDVFDIDPTNGDLTPVPNSPIAIATDGYGVTVTDAGDRAVVTGYSTSTVSVIDVAPDGTLTEAADSPINTIGGSTHSLISSNGAFLYANSSSNVASFSVGATGALTELGTSPLAGRGGSGWTIHRRPNTPQFYLPDGASFEGLSYDSVTGELTTIAGSPFAGSGSATGGMAFSPDGDRLFVREYNNTTLNVYDLDVDGVPTATVNSPYTLTGAVNGGDACMRISQDGTYLIVGADNGTVAVYTLDAAGAPSPVTNSPFSMTTTGTDSNSIATTW